MTLRESARPGRLPGSVPEIWGRIPPRNKNFTGREELLDKLRAGIVDQVTAVVPHALHGLGGVGKTQMAVEYAWRYLADYELVWWIPADQSVLVRSTLAALAPNLGLPPATTTGVEDAANAVLDALRRGEPYSRWLLIFDNADQPEDINDVVPRGPGHVLITSRNHRWEGVVDTVAVDVFSREESVQFLKKRVPRGINVDDADRLADSLGDLPLALEQAGALQAETGMSVPQYLRLLKDRTSQLLAEGKPTEYPVSMTAAWALSVASLGNKMPEAVDLLRCCAFFGPEPIPRDVFAVIPPGLGQPLSDLLGDPIRLARAIGELGRYALARIDTASRTIQVHRLIQALVRDELAPAEQERIRDQAHQLLVAAAPEDTEDTQNWRRYSDLLGHIGPSAVAQSHDTAVRKFALDIVRYLYNFGDYSSARNLVENFLDQWMADSGEGDLEILVGRRHLGNILRSLGEYSAAYEVNRAALKKSEEMGGGDTELTLQLVNSVGADLRARGDFLSAREHDETSLRRHQGDLGDTHSSTLRVMHNLALDYGLNSDYPRAREFHEAAYLGLRQGGWGVGRVGVLNALSGLARAVRLCGDYAEACDLGEEAYAYGVEELGAEHPGTLYAAKDLSIAWRRLGEFERSLELALEVHARYVRLFGLNHPDTLAAAMCLANIQRTVGEKEAALELAADTVRRYPRLYGAEHPYNHGCAGNLALLRRVFGDVQAARELNEKSLEGLEVKLGRDHHYSLTVATNLASDLAALGEFEEACRLGQDTTTRLRAVLGETHPMTLACAANLSADLIQIGEEEESAELLKKTMEAYAVTLGPEHPDAVVAAEHRHLDCDFDPPPI
ncbi:FxSxx-COOH system tetratricopeptide repeat protein [Actinomadura scrupuli]|uniref:FxSxx-COOH system tetratricopeptide repeat protein n=1 Tax=Actinomadura scrupuli TaxID=559629 RepID=UPI003D96F86E